MTHISGFERSQLLLLQEAIDVYVGADNPVRFIDALVDGLDLGKAGFSRVDARVTGQPGYSPGEPKRETKNVATLSDKTCQPWRHLVRASDPPPGNTVVWRGLRRLADIQLGAELHGGEKYG